MIEANEQYAVSVAKATEDWYFRRYGIDDRDIATSVTMAEAMPQDSFTHTLDQANTCHDLATLERVVNRDRWGMD